MSSGLDRQWVKYVGEEYAAQDRWGERRPGLGRCPGAGSAPPPLPVDAGCKPACTGLPACRDLPLLRGGDTRPAADGCRGRSGSPAFSSGRDFPRDEFT